MKLSEIRSVLRHFEHRVNSSDPMPASEKRLLSRFVDQYDWEQIKGMFRLELKRIAKSRDKDA